MPLKEIPHDPPLTVIEPRTDPATPQAAFWGARPGSHCVSVPQVTKSRSAAMRCYKGEILVYAMVQTKSQQTGDQSSPGRGVLQGVTAEGDVFAIAVSSGNTL